MFRPHRHWTEIARRHPRCAFIRNFLARRAAWGALA